MLTKWSPLPNKVITYLLGSFPGDNYARQQAAVTVKTEEAMDKLFDVLANRYK